MIGSMNQEESKIFVTVKQMDTFIDRVIKEKDYTLQSLYQEINFTLHVQQMGRVWFNIIENNIYKQIAQRLKQRIEDVKRS